MIHPVISHLHSADVMDLELYVPDPADFFGFYVEAVIGLDDVLPGGDIFGFLVCSPKWLVAEMQSRDETFVFGRHYIFMQRYDYALLHRVIQDLCDQAQGEEWDAVAAFLGRFGKWEFEDYQPYQEHDS